MTNRTRISLAFLLASITLIALVASGCELSQVPRPTPTLEGTQTAPGITPSATQLPASPTLMRTSTLPPVLATRPFTATPSEPTLTLTPSTTPGPYAYTIRAGDTFYGIVERPPFNYRDQASINAMTAEFLRLNPSVRSIDNLPSPGSIIYIPLQPPTPTPVGFELTQTYLPPSINNFTIPEDAPTLEIPIRENDTILRFAQEYETTLAVIATLNPQLSFRGCDFQNPSGGPDCNVFLVVGDNVIVPAPTATPTLSPTPSGSETPTGTPTYPPPLIVFPPQNGVAPARTFQLQWISAGALLSTERYFVEIQDLTSGATWQDVTRSTGYMLPESLIPSDGQPHTIQWRVSVAVANPDGTYTVAGAPGDWRVFTWQSR